MPDASPCAPAPPAPLAEAGVIATLAGLSVPPPGALGIGDDAALVPLPGGGRLLAALDTLIEGVHFRLTTSPPEDLGWRLLAVNLADLAAMGGTPTAALLSLSLPPTLPATWLGAFCEGLGALARAHGVWLAGGDTTGSPGPVCLSLTLLGSPPASGRALTRAAARPGDVLFLTGSPGLAAAGLLALEQPEAVARVEPALLELARIAHRRPTPPVAAGRALGALGLRLALLDDSDGLGRCAQLLAEASGVGLVLEPEALPLAEATRAIAGALGRDPLTLALHGGEDHHLVGTCAPADWPAVQATLAGVGALATRVGSAQAEDPGKAGLRGPAGAVHPLTGPAGFDHFVR